MTPKTGFTIPNAVPGSTFEQEVQGSPDTIDIQALVQAAQGVGVVSGCAVTANGTLILSVATGQVSNDPSTANVPVNDGSITLTAEASGNPRFDMVVANLTTGIVSVLSGTASNNPLFPTVDFTTYTTLCSVYLGPSDTTITSSDLIDKRMFVPDWASLFRRVEVLEGYLSLFVGQDLTTPILANDLSGDRLTPTR